MPDSRVPQPAWARAWWARALRRVLQGVVWRMQDHWMEIEVVHPERAAALPLPSLLIFNYQGPFAPLVIHRALPPHIRSRVAVAVDDRIWQGRDRWQGLLTTFVAQGFPFAKSGAGVRSSLDNLLRWLEAGYGVMMSPEGNPEVDGELLPFLGGSGLVAVKAQVPVVPFRLEEYHRLFPRHQEFPYLPNRRGRVRLIIGEPLFLPPGTPRGEATDRMRQALIETV